jgi:hypothetical protein
MTEAKWLACSNLQTMLEFLRGGVSDRKLRLFAIACFLQRRSLLEPDTPCWQLLEVVEQYSDGLLSRKAIVQAESAMGSKRHRPARAAIANAFGGVSLDADSVQVARTAARCALNLAGRAPGKSSSSASRAAAREVEKALQLQLLHEIVGNPFREIRRQRKWLTSDVRTLSEGIYQDRAFDRMPILADALQDAGCDNDDLLNHCRQPGEHVRGCWVIDLLTDRK